MNQFAEAVLAAGEKMLGTAYVVGVFNCDLFVRKAFGNVAYEPGPKGNLRYLIGGGLTNVRMFVDAADVAGTLRLASSGYVPQPGDVFFYGPADGTKPVRGAGHMGLVEEAPSAAHPNGVAMSAYSPTAQDAEGHKGTIRHRLIPKKTARLALWGFIAVPWPAPVVDPPIVNPDPPAPDDAIDEPTVAELLARIAAKDAKFDEGRAI